MVRLHVVVCIEVDRRKRALFLHVFSLGTLQCTYREGGHDTCLHHSDMYSKLALLYLQHEVGGMFLICFLTNFHGIYTCQDLLDAQIEKV